MEAKLQDAIATQDWYSAHQLLISLGQRHQRARRYAESKALLSSGLTDMCPTGKPWPPLATVADIALKYVEVYVAAAGADNDNADGKKDEEQSVAVFQVLLQACDVAKREEGDEKHTEVWADVSSRLLAVTPELSAPLLQVLLAASVPADWKMSWCVEHSAGDREAWARLAPLLATEQELVLLGTLHLLAQKAFGSASALLSGAITALKESRPSLVATPMDDATGSLPSFLCWLQDEDLRLVNAAQILFTISQRRSPPKILFTSVRDRFNLQDEAAQLIDVLQRVYSPQPKKPAGADAMNPLASMFQSMFSGGGAPGGFPMMPPPPSQRKAGKKNNGMDLD